MADLAQAIVDMTAAAKGRQIARAELDAATERIAAAIVGPFRSGDSVTIYRTQAGWVAEVGDERSASETVTASVERVTWPTDDNDKPHKHGTNALVIDSTVYSTRPVVGAVGSQVGRHINMYEYNPGGMYDLHMATGEERLRFCEMAPAIVEAFRKLAEVQAEEFAKGADAVSKTVVR
jgi:hypothetical protein